MIEVLMSTGVPVHQKEVIELSRSPASARKSESIFGKHDA
jgi:hypothetical protein